MERLSFEQLLAQVNDALSKLPLDKEPVGLYQPIMYTLSLGGKRIRPVLMLMAYNLYKEHPEDIVMPAVGLETYHNFTLLHDDVMDRADVRRGKPTVHKKWNENTAILSGDSMLVLAYQYMAQCKTEHLSAILDVFTKTALEIHEGQQYDTDFEKRNDVTEEEYIEMIRLKTSVLLACALKIGAILADAPKNDVDALYEFGEKIGLAFQLQDDYLDVYGDFKTFGKRIGGDILCNKKTYMLINALRCAGDAQRESLNQWISATEFDEEEKIAAVTRLYTDIGVDKLAQSKINLYYEEAKQAFDRISVSEDVKGALWQFAESLLGRKS